MIFARGKNGFETGHLEPDNVKSKPIEKLEDRRDVRYQILQLAREREDPTYKAIVEKRAADKKKNRDMLHKYSSKILDKYQRTKAPDEDA